jgi:predicted amidohydrolase YtcJ
VAGGRFVSGPLDGAAELPGAFVAPGLVDAHAHLTAPFTPRAVACRCT